jgi:hypothetical protein
MPLHPEAISIDPMSAARACTPAFRALVDSHFDASITPEGEQRLRAHLETCADCRGYYERHLVLARLDPGVPPAVERLGAGLGLASRPKSKTQLAVWGGLAAAAAAAVALLVSAPRTEGTEGFQARGSAVSPDRAHLVVSRLNEQGVPAELWGKATLPARAELAFAYVNPAAFRYLLVLAVDEHGHVYWYYPAWLDPKDTPKAISIERTSAPRPLGDAVRHDFDGHELDLLAAFGNEPLSVSEIEARLARIQGKAGAFSLPGFVVEIRHFELAP